jgi:hypothetical protein
MNSAYGTMGMKPHDKKICMINELDFKKYVRNNYNSITCIDRMPNSQYRVEKKIPLVEHFNLQFVAAMILEKAKCHMGKALRLQERLGSPQAGGIFYTDTDSMQGSRVCFQELQDLYQQTYNEPMAGNDLGQFNSDFEFDGAFMHNDKGELVPNSMKSDGEIVSKRMIVVGKKSYIHHLVDSKGQMAYHLRLKGIPSASLMDAANQHFNGDPIAMYEHLYRGEPQTFILKGRFRVTKTGSWSTIETTRTVKF